MKISGNLKKIMGEFFLSTAEVDYLMDGIGLNMTLDTKKHVFTLDGLRKTQFYPMLDWMLKLLMEKYVPADIEFTISFNPYEKGLTRIPETVTHLT